MSTRYELSARMGSGSAVLEWLDELPADLESLAVNSWRADSANSTITDHRLRTRRLLAGTRLVAEQVTPTATDED